MAKPAILHEKIRDPGGTNRKFFFMRAKSAHFCRYLEREKTKKRVPQKSSEFHFELGKLSNEYESLVLTELGEITGEVI